MIKTFVFVLIMFAVLTGCKKKCLELKGLYSAVDPVPVTTLFFDGNEVTFISESSAAHTYKYFIDNETISLVTTPVDSLAVKLAFKCLGKKRFRVENNFPGMSASDRKKLTFEKVPGP